MQIMLVLVSVSPHAIERIGIDPVGSKKPGILKHGMRGQERMQVGIQMKAKTVQKKIVIVVRHPIDGRAIVKEIVILPAFVAKPLFRSETDPGLRLLSPPHPLTSDYDPLNNKQTDSGKDP
jgi:hypothetical protein